MKPVKRQLIATPSQKSLTHVTQDSQVNAFKILITPNQSQKRFTRKNNNSSVERLATKCQISVQNDDNAFINNPVNTPRSSAQKITPGYVKLNTQLSDSRKNFNLVSINELKGGSFKLSRSKQIRISNLQETLRISQQKYTPKGTQKSFDQTPDRKGYETRTNNVSILRSQLQIKQQELLLLQDERRRFRNTIQDQKQKQKLLQQQLQKSQDQKKKIRHTFLINLQNLTKKLQQYEQNNKKLEEQNQNLKNQLYQQRIQKNIIEKQLNVFINKQVPKNIRQLQSCRQIYLEKVITSLKQQLSKNKSQLEKEMQLTIQKLRSKIANLQEQTNVLQIKNRVLEKKSSDSKRNLQSYNTAKQQLKQMRLSLKQSNSQCQLLRAENVKIKKQMKKLKVTGTPLRKMEQRKCSLSNVTQIHESRLKRVDSQTQSLNFSISTCSR